MDSVDVQWAHKAWRIRWTDLARFPEEIAAGPLGPRNGRRRS